MDFIVTDDGSLTFRNAKLDELYHTKSGAIVEALEKHARALKVWEKDNPIIFDVCSGLSYNAACAVEEIRRHNNTSLITLYLFENDKTALEANLKIPDVIEYVQDGKKQYISCYVHFKNAIKNFLENNVVVCESNNLKIIIVYGNFMETIDNVKDLADFVFYAPFSPIKTSNMWEANAFKKLYSHMDNGSKLSTYSYARRVRDGLKQAGFIVKNGPILGRRSPSLISIKE
ncbi:MAG: MnmC family methyltransferase [Candidatus Woesearchaeota archaeon]